ncbi:uncharacterized protein A4U43_C02F9950 [Asparagus officinalis]|uniref:Uncharacterized protein n=1 Tax=Asparagus officinalis TaxID=4686 RepID=A0A5P1FM93_ASPOF|nr:DNA-directed RNA polymerases II and IV subunit 5A-like [Asparagus officinalis]ONK77730.1 uncharacterized protein A4U43_C02F9950 [Asparagus officinalis]
MAASEEEVKLFRIRKNILEMLSDRGYVVADEELSMDFKQFRDKFGESFKREDLLINKYKRDNPSDQIYVFFPNDPKVGASHIKRYAERMKQDSVFKAIVVVQQISSFAKKGIQDQSFAQKFRVEIFQEAELVVNISKHMLVPPHQVLSDNEKKALLERYHLKETQLPRIQLDDPVARYHGLQRGQVVKIIRPSDTAGRYITYRYVV